MQTTTPNRRIAESRGTGVRTVANHFRAIFDHEAPAVAVEVIDERPTSVEQGPPGRERRLGIGATRAGSGSIDLARRPADGLRSGAANGGETDAGRVICARPAPRSGLAQPHRRRRRHGLILGP
jgi:hypothetical protein